MLLKILVSSVTAVAVSSQLVSMERIIMLEFYFSVNKFGSPGGIIRASWKGMINL